MPPTLFPGVALITGAAGTGIGAGIAKSFAAAGCMRIAITDRNEKLLNDTLMSINTKHPNVQIHAVAGDISSEKFVHAFVEEVVHRFGRLDYAVNCAGVLGDNLPTAEGTVEDFDQVNAVNYRGVWLCVRAELKAMLKQDVLESHDGDEVREQRGSIVNIASQLGIVGRSAAPAYCASKAAVIALTRSDAIDYSQHNIRVNCICPGLVETPMTACDEERIAMMQPAIAVAPMKRMGKPSEIADCALFLASTKASFVQGHAMVVDGGYIIN